jgi:hypothetical protein
MTPERARTAQADPKGVDMKTRKKVTAFSDREVQAIGAVRWLGLRDVLSAYHAKTLQCPVCGSHDLEANGGESLGTLSFCCVGPDCGEQFEGHSIGEVELPARSWA